jgi:hypothetical protein
VVVEGVAGFKRRLQRIPLCVTRVLDEEEAHSCSPAEVALIIAKDDRYPDGAIGVVDFDV